MKQTLCGVALLLAGLSSVLLAQDRADFTYVDRGDVSTLDPNRMSWLQDIRVGNALYEGLYALEPGTLKCIPGTAEKIDTSPDQLTWTFTIRPNAAWSNGDPVTSADFVFAWQRMLQSPGEYTYLLHYIKGAAQYEADVAKDPKRADFAAVGIKAPDARTVIVTLEHPVTFFPDLIAFTPFWPLNQRAMEPFKRTDPATGRVSYDEKFTLPGALVTNGPFKLTKWELRVGLRLEKNEHYWDKQNVKSNSVELVVAQEPLTSLRKYEAHEVDWLAEPNGEVSASLLAQKRKDLIITPAFGTYFYSVNCLPTMADGRPNPLKDPRVRRALSMAVNRRPIVEQITRCGEPTANTYIPPAVFPDYKVAPGPDFDLKAARQLMKEAGYPVGKGFPVLKLLFNTEGDHRTVAEYIAKQWRTNLNVTFELEGIEIAQFRKRLHDKQYDIARASWYGDYNDISTFTDKYLTGGDNNDSGWSNAEYDRLCAQAAREADPAKRTQMLAQAETILLTEQPIIPLYVYTNRYLLRDNVRGVIPTARNVVLLKYVWVQR